MSKEVDLREAWQLLMGAQSLVLVSHVGPDGDTLGSTLGLARALKLAGKRVRLLVDDILPAVYQFLPGLEAYEQPKAGEKIPCDLTVVVDASSKDRMGEAEKCLSAPILNIDHHVSNTRYADYLLLDEKTVLFDTVDNAVFQVRQHHPSVHAGGGGPFGTGRPAG